MWKFSPFVDVKSSGSAWKVSGESTQYAICYFPKSLGIFDHDFLYDNIAFSKNWHCQKSSNIYTYIPSHHSRVNPMKQHQHHQFLLFLRVFFGSKKKSHHHQHPQDRPIRRPIRLTGSPRGPASMTRLSKHPLTPCPSKLWTQNRPLPPARGWQLAQGRGEGGQGGVLSRIFFAWYGQRFWHTHFCVMCREAFLEGCLLKLKNPQIIGCAPKGIFPQWMARCPFESTNPWYDLQFPCIGQITAICVGRCCHLHSVENVLPIDDCRDK